MKQLSTDDLKNLKSVGKDFHLINVVPAHEFAETHIPGARNVPLDTPNFATQVERAIGGKVANVVVYCASEECPASTKAAEKLEAAGFTNVFDYKGGAKAWLAEQSRVPVA